MANHAEIKWLEIVKQGVPRFIESEGKWAVTYQNEFDLEVERFDTREQAVEFCRALEDSNA